MEEQLHYEEVKKAFWLWAIFWLLDVSTVSSLQSSVSAGVVREVPERSHAELDEVEDEIHENECPQDPHRQLCDS